MSFLSVTDKGSLPPNTRRIAKTLLVTILLVLVAASFLFARFVTRQPTRLQQLPQLVLWAWERPEDLRFVDPEHIAIAYLAGTIQLDAGGVTVHPRFQPLRVPDQAMLIAVVRIEAKAHAALDRNQLLRLVTTIAATASLPRVVAVQVDFDATLSQRAFYRDLLLELRRELPPATPISITAVASWCLADDWLADLPIDEGVPMLFRMGAGTNEVLTHVSSGKDFREPLCRTSFGISTDERSTALGGGRRYVFNPQPWTEHAELALLWETHTWH